MFGSLELGGNAVDEFDKLEAVFTPQAAVHILTRAARFVGVVAESEEVIPPYPAPSGNALPVYYTVVSEAKKSYKAQDGTRREPGESYASKFKSLRQHHKVFKMIADGDIPHVRTGTLGRSITSTVDDVTATSARVKVGSNTPYAPDVIGSEDEQSHYHQGNWWRLSEQIEMNADKLERAANAEAMRAVLDYINEG